MVDIAGHQPINHMKLHEDHRYRKGTFDMGVWSKEESSLDKVMYCGWSNRVDAAEQRLFINSFPKHRQASHLIQKEKKTSRAIPLAVRFVDSS